MNHAAPYSGNVVVMPKGTWRHTLDRSTPGPMLCCPGCGNVRSLHAHAISADGEVTSVRRERYSDEATTTPVVSCPTCGWTGFLRLQGWRG